MMRSTLDFLLFEWLDVEQVCARARFQEHSRATFESVLDTCERIAAERFAPFNRAVDQIEPQIEADRVIQPECVREAARAYAASGMLCAGQDYELGGMQLPCVVEAAGNAFFLKGSIGLAGGNMLTAANANLLRMHGAAEQIAAFARNEFLGRWFGTMCLSETQAGSSLSDIATRAVPDGADFSHDPLGPRYRLCGSKMWISNGDHELAENIVHLVLAKIPDAAGVMPPGTRGISLFIVPKHLTDTVGRLTGERNDVALAGLNHKLGYRGIPNTVLNFGEGRYPVRGGRGAIGYRVGEAGSGLALMFHMMNEARIAVGLGAVAIGYAAYEASLEYARSRRQGRIPGPRGKDASQPPVRIIEHADVKRMLLAQKAYVEGGLALELYCARLVDETRTGSPAEARDASRLLDILTPIAKSWPSEWCLEGNNLAIQVLGGYGYTRDFPVEQLWRDNRLNMIHEGTHGIQAVDLLGRKVLLDDGAALTLLGKRIATTVTRASAQAATQCFAAALESAFGSLREATAAAWAQGDAQTALANATPYMQAFGHVVIAWLWLELLLVVRAARNAETSESGPRADFLAGKHRAAQYFFDYELPKVQPWLAVVRQCNETCLRTREEWF